MKKRTLQYKPRRYLTRRSPYKTAQAALIGLLYDYNGGVRPLAKELNMTSARVLEWRHRGLVPLKYCPRVAAFYGVEPELLNYRDYVEFHAGFKKLPSWKELFSRMKVTEIIKKQVLSYPEV